MKTLKIIFPKTLENLVKRHVEKNLHNYYFKVINELWYRHNTCHDEYFSFSTKHFPKGPRDSNNKQHSSTSVIQFLRKVGMISSSGHAPTPENIEYYVSQNREVPKHINHYSISSNESMSYKFNGLIDEFEIDEVSVSKSDRDRLSRQIVTTTNLVKQRSVKNLTIFKCDVDQLETLMPRDVTSSSASRAFNACQQLNFDGYFGTEGENSRRVYNNLTTIPRWARPALRIRDEHIAEVDFACFQPRLLASLCDPAFREKFSYIIDDYVQYIEYPELTEEEIANIFDEDLYSVLGERDAIKAGMVTYLFGPAHRTGNAFQDGLVRVCPKVHELAKQIKSKKCSKVIETKFGRKVYYSSMARLLQNLEAEIMFNILGAVLVEEDIVFSTIHDAFVIAESDMDLVKEKVSEKLTKEGIRPFGRELVITSKVYK